MNNKKWEESYNFTIFLLVCREETGYKYIQNLPVSDAISPRIKGNTEKKLMHFLCVGV